jgi:hypothetical protein
MCGRRLSRNFVGMHTLNARIIAAQIVEERIDGAARARRFARTRRRFGRGERRAAPSSPLPPGRLQASRAGE